MPRAESSKDVWRVLLRDTGIAVLVTAILRLVALVIVPWRELAREVGLDLVIFLLIFSYSILAEVWPYRNLLAGIVSHRRENKRSAAKLTRFFWERALNGFHTTVSNTFGTKGEALSSTDLEGLCRLCFENGKGVYHGTDSHLPSRFVDRYPYYLAYQEKNVQKQSQPGIRILIVSQKALERDFRENARKFRHFEEWHLGQNVDLLQVDPAHARRISSSFDLLSTDIGIWDRDYVMSFSPFDESTDTRVAIYLSESEAFERSLAYFLSLIELSSRFSDDKGELQFDDSANTRTGLKQRVQQQWKK